MERELIVDDRCLIAEHRQARELEKLSRPESNDLVCDLPNIIVVVKLVRIALSKQGPLPRLGDDERGEWRCGDPTLHREHVEVASGERPQQEDGLIPGEGTHFATRNWRINGEESANHECRVKDVMIANGHCEPDKHVAAEALALGHELNAPDAWA